MKKVYYFFVLVLVGSVIFNFYVDKYDYKQAIPGIIYQLFGSLILGYVFSRFYTLLKCKESDWKKWWLFFYALMVGAGIVALILGVYPC